MPSAAVPSPAATLRHRTHGNLNLQDPYVPASVACNERQQQLAVVAGRVSLRQANKNSYYN